MLDMGWEVAFKPSKHYARIVEYEKDFLLQVA